MEFEALVEAHSGEIFAYVWRLLRDTADAEDCLQDTFLRAYRSFSRVKAGSNYRAWLYKIATNTARTYAKQRGRINARTIDLDPDLESDRSSPAERVEQRQLIEAVTQAVEALPHQQRAALLMRQYQELSYEDIAAALECSEEAARANVYQALRKLRMQFSEPTNQRVSEARGG
jgi:RNA polymerase sigma-70 factor (ECF subfamily)